ncbi:hypothetical protein F7725_001304 [Dissostichus mawsoni]|uniref:Deubiquitinating enzyme A n=1 Tax=Dissostichus mawsoni TaxID=36200 RepID=A0A7J5ZJB4_DISMA|nr:hypothetical protein F7725_001304 [Dissostichus mawsoni]
MTILPKKKPSSGVGVSDDDSRTGPDAHPGRSGARQRASPPPWSYPPAPPSDRRGIEASTRPQQASPPPVGSVSPGGPTDSPMVPGSLAVSSGGSGGSCCSGPGLSKRRRQTQQGSCSAGVVAALTGGGQPGVTGPGGGTSGQDTEEGAGNNSEDEYENAARLQSMDPATVEQVYGDQDMHEVVRKHCMDYLMKNADYFSNYVTEDFTTYQQEEEKQLPRQPHRDAGDGGDPINTFHGIHQNNDEPIRVSYHRNIHYNSVVNPNKATIGVGLGLPAFKPGYAEQTLMKSAIKTSEESWIEQQMLEDKKRATDWEATNEAIEEQVARESYLQWLQDQEKQARQLGDGGRLQRTGRLERPVAAATRLRPLPLPLSRRTPDPPTNQSRHQLEYRAIMQEMSPTAFGLTDWEDDEILASVLAVSQQEYMDSMKHQSTSAMHREREPSPDSS